MRVTAILVAMLAACAGADDVESRVLTHYIPQDFLEKAIRTEGWTEVPLDLKGGVRKGDTVRIWAGGSIDRGNGDQPGENVGLPTGIEKSAATSSPFALSQDRANAYAVLYKTDSSKAAKCRPAGKALELSVAKDKERIWIGFNDLKGHYNDNHLGKGRRHELDPLWIRIEVVRTITD